MCAPVFNTRQAAPPWIAPEVMSYSRRKHKLLRKTKHFGRSARIEIKNIQREIKKRTNLSHPTYVADVAARAMESKLFWAYVNSQRKSSSARPGFSHNNKTVSDPAATSALFNEHFA